MKKAKEFGEAEVWMNERMMRAAPNAAAEFITGFGEDEAKVSNKPAPRVLLLPPPGWGVGRGNS